MPRRTAFSGSGGVLAGSPGAPPPPSPPGPTQLPLLEDAPPIFPVQEDDHVTDGISFKDLIDDYDSRDGTPKLAPDDPNALW